MSTKELVFESFPIHEYLVDKIGYKVGLEFELRTAIMHIGASLARTLDSKNSCVPVLPSDLGCLGQ